MKFKNYIVLGAILWLPRGLASLFNASKIHRTLGTRTFQIYSGILLFVEICFLLIMHFTANDEKLDLVLIIILDYSLFTLGMMTFICYNVITFKYVIFCFLFFKFIACVGTLICILYSEMGNVDEKEKSKFGWTMEIIRKYWAPAWQ